MTVRVAAGAAPAGLSGIAPIVLLPLGWHAGHGAYVTAVIVCGLQYSMLLQVHADSGRATAASITAFVTVVVGGLIASTGLFFLILMPLLVWPVMFVVAWSMARRPGLGVGGVLIGLAVVAVGYVATFQICVAVLDVDSPTAVLAVLAACALIVQFLANGAVWLYMHVRAALAVERARSVA